MEHEVVGNPFEDIKITPKAITEVLKGIIMKLSFKPVVILEHEVDKDLDSEEIEAFAVVCNMDNPVMNLSLTKIYMSIIPVSLDRQIFVVLKDGELNISGTHYPSDSEDVIEDPDPLIKMFMYGDRVIRTR